MNSRICAYVLAALLVGAASSTHAASISLIPTSATANLNAGDIVMFEILMDFTSNDSGLGSDMTIGGGYDVVWDANALTFHDLFLVNITGNFEYQRAPDLSPGLTESWSFGNFQGLTGPLVVGYLDLEVLPGAPASSFVMTRATSGIGGPFISGVDFVTELDVQFNSVEITTVPVPAALWLLLGGLGTLRTLGSRKWSNNAD